MTTWGRCAARFGIVIGLLGAEAAQACGPSADCQIGDRHYRIRMPAGHDGVSPVGAVIFAHGYRGSAAGAMRSRSLGAAADRLGVALIAVKSAADDWSIPNAPGAATQEGVDEYAYFDAVRADAASRFPIDLDRVMATGFSAGGMMIWELACRRSGDYAAFAPMAGAFWAPVPPSCDGPAANIVHIHGLRDRTVPLGGRPILDARQGAIADALAMYRGYGGFEPAPAVSVGRFDCERSVSPAGAVLRFCLFDGAHDFSGALVEAAWEMFAEEGVLPPPR